MKITELAKELGMTGKEVLEKFREAVSEYGTVDKAPVLEGRFYSMIVAPVKNK